MKLILTEDLSVPDIRSLCQPLITQVIIPAGEHEVKAIPNPWPAAQDGYIALAGTQIGAGAGYLKSLKFAKIIGG